MKCALATMTALFVLGLGGSALAVGLPGGLDFPVCDMNHHDSCLILGQNAPLDRQLFAAFPRCQKMKGRLERGACINQAGGVTSQ